MTANQRFLIALTILNGAFTVVSVSQLQAANAASDVSPVLRGRALEIVDEAGRVRASIKVHPADPKVKMPDGSPTGEYAVLRLVNPDGRPGVKIASSDTDPGLSLIGTKGNYLQASLDGVKLTRDSRQRAA